MTYWRVLVVIACLCTTACEKDPARSVKIAERPAPPAAVLPSAGTETTPPSVSANARPVATVASSPLDESPSVPANPSPSSSVPRNPAPASSAPASLTRKQAIASGDIRAPVLGSAATAAPTAPQQPRTADKVASTEAVANAPPTSPAQSAASEPRPNGCPPPPEDSSGPSTLTVSGPCAFEHKGIANCEWHADDFYLSMTRKAAQGATLTVYINVEGYDGPGQYKSAQMFIGVQDKTSIYRWSSDAVTITVGPDQEFAVLPTTKLAAEPVLIDCTGPMTNYQCGGRGESKVFIGTAEVVAGTLRCDGGGKKKS